MRRKKPTCLDAASLVMAAAAIGLQQVPTPHGEYRTDKTVVRQIRIHGPLNRISCPPHPASSWHCRTALAAVAT